MRQVRSLGGNLRGNVVQLLGADTFGHPSRQGCQRDLCSCLCFFNAARDHRLAAQATFPRHLMRGVRSIFDCLCHPAVLCHVFTLFQSLPRPALLRRWKHFPQCIGQEFGRKTVFSIFSIKIAKRYRLDWQQWRSLRKYRVPQRISGQSSNFELIVSQIRAKAGQFPAPFAPRSQLDRCD